MATLFNLGKTCYLNAVIHVLRQTPHFAQSLKVLCQQITVKDNKGEEFTGRATPTGPFPDKEKAPLRVVLELNSLFNEMNLVEERFKRGMVVTPIRPEPFVKAFRGFRSEFVGTKEHDPNEALMAIMDAVEKIVDCQAQLHGKEFFSLSTTFPTSAANDPGFFRVVFQLSESKAAGQEADNFIKHLFGGSKESTKYCHECETESVTTVNFQEVSLGMESGKSYTVAELMEAEVKSENIQGCFCDICKEYLTAEKTVTFSQMPKVLHVQLKRFSYDRKSQTSLKLANIVQLNENLKCFCQECNARDFTQRNHSYELFAIVTHTGDDIDHGHCMSYIKSESSWFNVNDCRQSQVTEKEFQDMFKGRSRHTPYLLFFRLQVKDLKTPGVDDKRLTA